MVQAEEAKDEIQINEYNKIHHPEMTQDNSCIGSMGNMSNSMISSHQPLVFSYIRENSYPVKDEGGRLIFYDS